MASAEQHLTPPAGSDATPPAGSDATPPAGSDATPPAGSDATPPAGDHRPSTGESVDGRAAAQAADRVSDPARGSRGAAPAADRVSDPVRVGRGGDGVRGRAVYRSSRFTTPTRGVRIGAERVTLVDAVAATLLVLPAGSVVCGWTAARLWRLPIPRQHEDGPLTVTIPADGPHLARHGVRVTRATLHPKEVTEHLGIPVITAERTFAELAATLAVPDLVAVGDVALRRGLLTERSLQAALTRRRGRRGVRAARVAAGLLDALAESPQESRLRAAIVMAGLPTPTPQYVVRDAAGGFVARVDLAYPDRRIAIEYDGEAHASPARRRADATRRTHLRSQGWYVVEIVADDLRYPDRALAKVTAALDATASAAAA